MKKYNYFSSYEFTRCNPPCDISQMSEDFLTLLDSARELADIPFVLTSAFRSVAWDKSKGRSGNGYHTKGCAVDVACIDGRSRAAIVRACLSVGLSCGVSKTFVHVDNRPFQTLFLY